MQSEIVVPLAAASCWESRIVSSSSSERLTGFGRISRSSEATRSRSLIKDQKSLGVALHNGDVTYEVG